MLTAPLRFTPVYQNLIWGGRRMAAWRGDLPDGPVGESWDLADHPRGMSLVAQGPHTGCSLRELTSMYGPALVGDGFTGGDFPLMVKLIDANERLSVQVHPDDALARSLGVGQRGKTECWLMVGDGGELFVGTQPGTDRALFEKAVRERRVADTLNRFRTSDGDFFFLAARTVHAVGSGCLLYEVQQTCDVTFRVDDWGRVGLDGKPRPLHVSESLATIDFSASSNGPVQAAFVPHPQGGSVRYLADCAYFTVQERRATRTAGGGAGRCSIVICLSGSGHLTTAGGELTINAMQTLLVPAAAGPWIATAITSELHLLVAQP